MDEVDPEYEKEKILFYFLSPQIYSQSVQLKIRPLPQQLIRAFLIFGFGNNEFGQLGLGDTNNRNVADKLEFKDLKIIQNYLNYFLLIYYISLYFLWLQILEC